jgi:hypothetical protein
MADYCDLFNESYTCIYYIAPYDKLIVNDKVGKILKDGGGCLF